MQILTILNGMHWYVLLELLQSLHFMSSESHIHIHHVQTVTTLFLLYSKYIERFISFRFRAKLHVDLHTTGSSCISDFLEDVW